MALQLRTPPHIVDAQLGHKPQGLSGAFKNYAGDHDYLPERTEALRAVADHIDDIALA